MTRVPVSESAVERAAADVRDRLANKYLRAANELRRDAFRLNLKTLHVLADLEIEKIHDLYRDQRTPLPQNQG